MPFILTVFRSSVNSGMAYINDQLGSLADALTFGVNPLDWTGRPQAKRYSTGQSRKGGARSFVSRSNGLIPDP
jgi:hypothetical protein